MLAISVEFLHETMRAASDLDVTLTGDAAVEWPPSPARLYSALIAADGTGERCKVTGGNVGLDLLEAPPRILADNDVIESRVKDRFVVIDKTDDSAVQNYPARKAQLVHPGARVSMRDRRVAFCWDGAEPTIEELAALRLRAARVGYLGCSDSPVRVRVHSDPSEVPAVSGEWVPDGAGDRLISVPYPGLLDVLDASFEAWQHGEPRRRGWIPPRLVAYRSPGSPAVTKQIPVTLWVRFDRPIGGRRVVAVAETLRAAVLERVDRIVGGPDGVPEVIHGHHREGLKGVEHVRWLPLPDAGFTYSDGRIRGACIWLPPRTDPVVLELMRQAIAGIVRLVRPELFDVGMAAFDGTRAPWASNPARWAGPSRRWVSVFPVMHERWTKRGLDLGEIARWCEHAGLSEPVDARWSTVPLLHGAVALRGADINRAGRESRPVSHVEVRFAEPARGPLALGRGRHFGLGLMAPLSDHSR